MYGRREDNDTVNDQTFGLLEPSNDDRAFQEFKRRGERMINSYPQNSLVCKSLLSDLLDIKLVVVDMLIEDRYMCMRCQQELLWERTLYVRKHMTTIEDTCFQRTLADLLNVMFSFSGHVQVIIVAVIFDYNHG